MAKQAGKKLGFDAFVDFTNEQGIDKAFKKIEQLPKKYKKAVEDIKKQKGDYVAAIKEMVKVTAELEKKTTALNPTIQAEAKVIAESSKQAKTLSVSYNELKGKVIALDASQKNLIKEQELFNTKAKEAIRLNKERATLEARLASATSTEAKEVEKLRLRLAEANKERKRTAKEALGLVSLYDKESAKLNVLAKRYQELSLKYGQNSIQAKKVKVEHDKLRASLTSVDAALQRGHRDIGRYSTAMSGAVGIARQFATALGFTGVVYLLVQAVGSAVKTFINFQKQGAVLAGVMGKTRSETVKLTEEAKRLGAITARTATEVLEAEINMARLGFTEAEIIASTGDIINGSIALNAGLADTAQLTGAVIRAFDDLGATDAEEILDKITKATQISSNSFETLATSLPKVAGAANAMDISLEQVLRDLSIAQDATQDASIAGTSLRKIYLELAKSGQTYDDALTEISQSSNKVAKALDLFGVRAAVTALALANNRDRAGEMDAAIDQAGGTIERVAAVQLKTLSGKLTLLKSAWEGFIFGVEDGEGRLSQGIGRVTQTFTNFLTLLNDPDTSGLEAYGLALNPIITLQALFIENEAVTERLNKIQKERQALNEAEHLAKLSRAQTIFNHALEIGVDTFGKFDNLKFTRELLDQKDGLEIATMVQELYNQKIREESDALNAAVAALIDADEKREEIAGKRKKFNEAEGEAIFESAKLRVQTEIEANDRVVADDKATHAERIDAANKALSLRTELIRAEEGRASKGVEENSAQSILIMEQADANIINIARESADKIIAIDDELTAKKLKNQEKIKDALKDAAEQAIEDGKKYAEEAAAVAKRVKDMIVAIVVNVIDLFANLSEQKNIKDEEQIEKLSEKRDIDLLAAGENVDAQIAIEKRFDEQKEKIEKRIAERKRKVAIADKAFAIASIAIDTAVGAANAASKVVTLPLVPFILALGAVQAAVVASTPIPQFARGTMDAPAGDKIVGEAGREMVVTPQGQAFLTGSRAEVRTDIPEGSAILTNAITENILNNPSRLIERNLAASSIVTETPLTEKTALRLIESNADAVKSLLGGLGSEMDKRPSHHTNITERGIERLVRRKGSIVRTLNAENSTGGEG